MNLREIFEKSCTAEPLAEGWPELEKFGMAVVEACAAEVESHVRHPSRLYFAEAIRSLLSEPKAEYVPCYSKSVGEMLKETP